MAYKFPIDSKKQTYQFFQTDLGKAFPADFVRTDKVDGLSVYVYVCNTGTQPYKIQGLLPGTLTDTRTVWVEPTTGAIVKGEEHQVQTLATGQAALDTTLTFDDKSIKNEVDTANKALKKLQIAGVWAPIILAILGIAALVGGVLLLRRRGEGGLAGGDEPPAENAPPDWMPGYGESDGTDEGAPPALSGSSQT